MHFGRYQLLSRAYSIQPDRTTWPQVHYILYFAHCIVHAVCYFLPPTLPLRCLGSRAYSIQPNRTTRPQVHYTLYFIHSIAHAVCCFLPSTSPLHCLGVVLFANDHTPRFSTYRWIAASRSLSLLCCAAGDRVPPAHHRPVKDFRPQQEGALRVYTHRTLQCFGAVHRRPHHTGIQNKNSITRNI